MFSIKRLICVLLVLISAMVFCSCQFEEERIDGAPDSTPKKETVKNEKEDEDADAALEEEKPLTRQEVDALAEAALEKMSKIPEYPAGYPSLEDVVAQYKRANEAIGWIVGTELIATDGDYTHTAHGMKYYKVLPDCYLGAKAAGDNPDADMLIYNKKTLEAYIATLISADEAHDYVLDITESFEIPRFTQSKNGELYALPYAFPPAGYGEEDTYEMTANQDGSYTLHVHYDILDDNDEFERKQTYDVRYVKKDGRWVFENFRVVKQH